MVGGVLLIGVGTYAVIFRFYGVSMHREKEEREQ